MSQVVTIPSPKSRFCSNPDWVQKHRDLMANPYLSVSLDHALMQYQATLTHHMSSDMAAAAAVGLRMMGAQEFLNTLRSLAETGNSLPTKPDAKSNLNHRT